MSRHVPFALGGPVLLWELRRAARRPWPRLLFYGYAAWLLLQQVWFQGAYRERWSGGSLVGVADDLAFLLLQQQLALLVLVTPAVTAGALGREKDQDTLSALLATQLEPREILAGKLLGRLAVLAVATLPALPLLVAEAPAVGLRPAHLLLLLAHQAAVTFALGCACLLVSVWTRRASDAILASYSLLALGYFFWLPLSGLVPVPAWLDPVAFTGPAEKVIQLGLWAALGVGCFTVAAARVAPAARRQAERRVVAGWLWALRPSVGDDPVRWRERYVIGLAPLPWLRMVPGPAGTLGVLAFSSILACDALEHASQGILAELSQGDFALARRSLANVRVDHLAEGVNGMGVVLLVVGVLVLGVRSAGSVAEEKRRKTWDDLLLTPLSVGEIIRSKTWGALEAAVVPLLTYALPMLALGAVGGWPSVGHVVAWVVGAAAAMALAGFVGAPVAEDTTPSKKPYIPGELLGERGPTRPRPTGDRISPDRRRFRPDRGEARRPTRGEAEEDDSDLPGPTWR